MPTSHYVLISKIVDVIVHVRPLSILDVGTGFGKYGILAREYLDYNPHGERKIKIEGIEIFSGYINDGHRYFYDRIHTGNALDIIPQLGHYDLILIIDVLEHFTEADGKRLLESCRRKGTHVLISTPQDIDVQGAVFGNEFERHLFQWRKRHFKEFKPLTFFWNYHSILCLLGPQAKEIKKKMSRMEWKLRIRSYFPTLYLFYRKKIRKDLSGNE